ncbi:MAG: DUF6916 family protein [Acidimicrobiales bacterium]
MEDVKVFSRALFRPHVGEDFDLFDGEGGRVTVRLKRLADRGGAPHTTMFSLYFVVPPGGPESQGTYRLEREGLGAVELFLVPVRQDGESIVFEAAMNLLGSDGE